MSARWERDARLLVKSSMYADFTEREVHLWNYLRMALDEIDRLRSLEESRIDPKWDGNTYGDGY